MAKQQKRGKWQDSIDVACERLAIAHRILFVYETQEDLQTIAFIHVLDSSKHEYVAEVNRTGDYSLFRKHS